jgi:hypothetical protein
MGLLSLLGMKSMAQTAEPSAPDTALTTIAATDPKEILSSCLYMEAAAHDKGWTPVLGFVLTADMNIVFDDKFNLNAHTDFFLNNWNDPGRFSISPFSMYLKADAKTKAGDFGVGAGHLQTCTPYTFMAWGGHVPLQALFYGSVEIGVSGNLPKTVLAQWRRNGDGVQIGYAEMEREKSGFAFNGKNPTFVALAEKSFANGKFKAKGGIKVGKEQTIGDAYFLFSPGKKTDFLLNIVNLGTEKPAILAGQRFNNKKFTTMISEIYQQGGVGGAWVNLCFPFGGYISAGVVHNDPRWNREAKTTYPVVSIGYYLYLSKQK